MRSINAKERIMKILFYGTKSYDQISFDRALADYPTIKIDYIETELTPMTASLARGYDAVCAFVNSDISALTLESSVALALALFSCVVLALMR